MRTWRWSPTHTLTVASVVKSPLARLVGDHPHALDPEEVLLPAGGTAHQQLERGVGRLEVVALVLQPLEVVDHLVDGRTVHRQAELGGLHLDRGPAGHLADDEARAVADQLGIDVLVGILGAGDGADVQPGLVGERRRRRRTAPAD